MNFFQVYVIVIKYNCHVFDPCLVPTYDWTSHFAVSFKKIVGIKGYYHFKADAASPGKVLLHCVADGPVTEVNILKVNSALICNDLPPVVTPKGLTSERQWCLYDKIRPYCREECKDLTCPLPEAPQPVTHPVSQHRELMKHQNWEWRLSCHNLILKPMHHLRKKDSVVIVDNNGHNRRCPNSDN